MADHGPAQTARPCQVRESLEKSLCSCVLMIAVTYVYTSVGSFFDLCG